MKFLLSNREQLLPRSRPARGAWVEIIALGKLFVSVQVAPRKGRVG